MTRTEHLLFKLAEEAAEVAQRASKAARFGLAEIQPGQPMNNAQRIVGELNDLRAVVELLDEASAITSAADREHIDRHKVQVERFLDYSRECGTLHD